MTKDSNYYTNETTVPDHVLVDYILQLLPDKQHQALAQRLENDSELQSRLSTWEQALFSLNHHTAPVTPPEKIWENISQSLFADASRDSKQRGHNGKKGFGFYLIPAFFSLCLVFLIAFYTAHQPDYAATVADNNQVIWQVQGNDKHIRFVSVNDISMPNRVCVAWLHQPGEKPVSLGVIPDTGKEKTLRIATPKTLTINAGDKIVITMVDADADPQSPPPASTAGKTVTLQDI